MDQAVLDKVEKMLDRLDEDITVNMKVRDLLLLEIVLRQVANTVTDIISAQMRSTVADDIGQTEIDANKIIMEFGQAIKHAMEQGTLSRMSKWIHDNNLCQDPNCGYELQN